MALSSAIRAEVVNACNIEERARNNNANAKQIPQAIIVGRKAYKISEKESARDSIALEIDSIVPTKLIIPAIAE